MKLACTLVGALLCAGTVTAQITPLGAGTAPLFVSGSPQPGHSLDISPFLAPWPFVIAGTTRVDVQLSSMWQLCQETLVPALDIVMPVTMHLDIPNSPSVVGFTFYAQGLMVGVGTCFVDSYFYAQLTEAVQITIQ
ncbi:MAG: hypothetical protein H6835_11370 [Planctomycetes bacterium]|nr:hypothetical protein [Planctomycetota bacterium]